MTLKWMITSIKIEVYRLIWIKIIDSKNSSMKIREILEDSLLIVRFLFILVETVLTS